MDGPPGPFAPPPGGTGVVGMAPPPGGTGVVGMAPPPGGTGVVGMGGMTGVMKGPGGGGMGGMGGMGGDGLLGAGMTFGRRNVRLPPEVNRILYVRNLPYKISADELYDIFGKYGSIRQIRRGNGP
eukprot:SRR837773.26872.p2 GENE.SRR837773.26872~~SRR837773.26872.p2  ORF type:complete len:136 (-),score=38.57 SRR837773.26872:256-633(-)